MTMSDVTHPITLSGLDGANSLGFLAALGTVRAATLYWPQHPVQMAWSASDLGWRPELHLHPALEQEEFLAGLNKFLHQTDPLQWLADYKDLTIPVDTFREAELAAAQTATAADRAAADFLAALGSDAVEAQVNGKKNGLIADTALRTMSGAGHQHFIGFMRQLTAATEAKHLSSALFDTWTYVDPGPSLRWDPIDDRRYALRWHKPAGDPLTTVRGANRLAIEALPMLPTIPVKTRLETTGFTQYKGQGTIWSWPLWDVPLGLDEIRSVLSHPMLKNETPDRHALLAIGVIEIYRCRRITQGKYRNFTPAQPI
jgi:hypothetical protein